MMLVVYRNPKLKTTLNILIVNMAAADILSAVTVVPYSVAYLYQRARWFPGGFGVFLCKLIPFLALVSIGASVLTLTAITIDRYLAIIHTIRKPLTPNLTVVVIASTWVISCAVFATELYKFKIYTLASNVVICAPRWVDDLVESHKITMYEMIIRFFLLYLIPVVGMAMVYSKIVIHLWRRRDRGKNASQAQQRIRKQKKKIITMLVTIVTAFAICWLPAHVNHFILTFDFATYSCLPASLVLTLYFMTHANSAINPCLYLIFNESFRRGLAPSALKAHHPSTK